MHEYTAQAIILDKEPFRDYDNRVTFLTERFGKLTGKATSTRKIRSKLSAHLEPGNLVHLRFVEKRGLQIVDSVKNRKIKASLPELYALAQLLPEGEPDPELWNLIKKTNFSWREILAVLGWSPEEANCFGCNRNPSAFHLIGHEMYCGTCALKLPAKQLIYF